MVGKAGKPVTQEEYFAVVHLASRFSLSDGPEGGESKWGSGDPGEEVLKEEEKAKPEDEGWIECRRRHKESFSLRQIACARYAHNDHLCTLARKRFYCLDPFSVTHLDLLNRAFDYLVLGLQELLCQGLDNPELPAHWLATLFLLDPVQGHVVECYPLRNPFMDPITSCTVLWRHKQGTPENLTMWDHFTQYQYVLSRLVSLSVGVGPTPC